MSTASRRLLLAALVVLLAVGCGGKTSEDLLASAKARAAKRDHAGAVVELKSILQQTPDSGEARYLLGVSLLEQGDATLALVEFRKAEDLKVADDLLLPKLARAQVSSGKAKDVIDRFAKVVLSVPTAQAELRAVVAEAYMSLNQRAAAAEALAEALRADPSLPRVHLTQARLLAGDGKSDEALRALDKVLVSGGVNGEAHLLRGVIERWSKKDDVASVRSWERAAEDPLVTLQARSLLIQAALSQGAGEKPDARAQLAALSKTHPKHPHVLFMDAVVSYATKDFVRAEAIADGLIRVAPDNPRLLVLGGAANLQLGHLIAAETKLGRVVQTVERMTVARKLLAETYLRLGQPEKALSALRPLFEQGRPDVDALALSGQAHLLAGNLQEAEAMFTQAVKLKPDNVHVRTALALTDLVKGNAEAAFDSLQSIAAKDPGETADLALISAYLRRSEFDAALIAIAALEKKQPTKPTAAQLRGLALGGKGDRAGSRAAFESALKLQPDLFSAVAALASMDLQDGKPDLAVQRYKEVIQKHPQNAQARMALVNVMAKNGAKPEQLLAEIEAAIRAAPTEPGPRVAKIAQLSSQNDVKSAASAAQDAMAALPDSPAVLDAAGSALANAGDDQQALSAFNKLATVLPRSALPHLRLADVHQKRGDAGAVAASLNRAFEIAPESADVHQRVLAKAIKVKDFMPVLKMAKDLQLKFPRSAAGYLLEGDAESAQKHWPAAAVAYRAALGMADAAEKPQKLLYASLRRSDETGGAERFASDWLRRHPKDASFREFLSGQAILRRDFAAAEGYLREVVSSQPRNGAAINNLAWVLAERRQPGAVAMAERALALSPNAAPVLDTLAKALAAEEQFDRAIDTQRRAIATMPSRLQYRLNLVRHLIKGGKRPAAVVELDGLAKLDVKAEHQAEVDELRRMLAK